MSEKNKIINQGIIFTIIASIILVTATLIHFYMPDLRSIIISLIFVVLEPAGVFFLWQGLDKIIFGPNSVKKELEFYYKMTNARIIFENA